MKQLSAAWQRHQAVMAVIADEVSRKTLHTWLARYEAAGLKGLVDRSHRPVSCPHQMPALVEATLCGARRRPIGAAGAWAWDRRHGSVFVAPLMAATLARHGAATAGRHRSGRRRSYGVTCPAQVGYFWKGRCCSDASCSTIWQRLTTAALNL